MSSLLFKKKTAARRDVRPRPVAHSSTISGTDGAEGSKYGSAADEAESTSRALAIARHDSDGEDESAPSAVVNSKRRKVGTAGKNAYTQSAVSARTTTSRQNDAVGDEEDAYALMSGLSESDIIRDRSALDARQDATRASDWFDEESRKSGEVSANSSGASAVGNSSDGIYRGTAHYDKFTVERDDGRSSKLKAASKGPVKGGSNVRTITMVDYQPDVCKDYKETGYCGFGDTCKFLHDRSDYLAGWQLDSLSNGGKRREELLDHDDDAADEDDDDVPFACLICRQPFTDPIVTKCGHFFCSTCAIKRFSKTSKCFACGKQTQGIFNSALKILSRMEKVRALKQAEREERRWDRDNASEQQAGNDQVEGQLLDGVEVGEDGARDDE